MQLIFFDEAKNDPDYQFFHMCAVVIDEEHLVEIEGEITELAVATFGKSTLERGCEFHGAEIFHRKGVFKPWEDFDKRIDILGKFIDILSSEHVSRIVICIDCEKTYANDPPEKIAFNFLVEKANSLMRERKKLGMLIGDRESDAVAGQFAERLSRYRAGRTDYAFGREITNLVDSVHFTGSHLSRFLQLADVYTWLTHFRRRNAKSDNFRHKRLMELVHRDHVNLFPTKYKDWPK